MKVVLFCGGFGTRLREHSDAIPKPLVNIGNRPIIWHLMKYYAHFGHKEFILCLGFRGDMLREYFMNYKSYLTGDITLEPGGLVTPRTSDIDDWRITFVDTGLHSNLGERLLRVRDYLDDDEQFLVNYSDSLTDLDFAVYEQYFAQRDAIASFVAIKPPQSFHAAIIDQNDAVTRLQPVGSSDIWLNGGFMIFRKEIFDVIEPGEELVEQPFERLIEREKLIAYKHQGFWASMDTFKDKINFDRLEGSGNHPWAVWTR
jgi:glucose-1-phosphate cytidylyltransferase